MLESIEVQGVQTPSASRGRKTSAPQRRELLFLVLLANSFNNIFVMSVKWEEGLKIWLKEESCCCFVLVSFTRTTGIYGEVGKCSAFL